MRRSQRESGQVLLAALGVTVILIGMLAMTASNQQSAIKAEANRMAARRTRMGAMAAGQLAIQYLMEGNSGVGATTTATPTTLTSGNPGPQPPADTTAVSTTLDDWYTMGQNGDMKFVLGDVSFRMQIVDSCSLLDINEATSTELQNVGLMQQQADSITDFDSAGETPQPDGAKDDFYNSLPNPYNAKLARFDTVDELLQVQWMTPDALYDPQQQGNQVQLQALPNGQMPSLYDLATVYAFAPNTTSTGATRTTLNALYGRLSARTRAVLFPFGPPTTTTTRPGAGRPGGGGAGGATGRQARPGGGGGGTGGGTRPGAPRNPTYTTMAQVFRADPGMPTADAQLILDNMSYGSGTQVEGLININTASQNVLSVLPNMDPNVAAAIVQQQGSGFQTLGDLLTVPGVTARMLGQIGVNFCIASTTYECRVIVTAGSEQDAYTVVVQVTGGVPQIIAVNPAPFSASQMLLRWGWQPDSTGETDLIQNSSS